MNKLMSLCGACGLLLVSLTVTHAADPATGQTYSSPDGLRQVGHHHHLPNGYDLATGWTSAPPHTAIYGNYPVTGAPLYPSPVQYTPPWNGGTIITNQALAPHEMLYPHEYHAMYGPFYYEVCGKWYWTPLGMRQHERWRLRGTEVDVEYHSQRKLFSMFHPPR